MEALSSDELQLKKPDGEERAPSSAKKIADEYKKVSQALVDAVETQWKDVDLQSSQEVNGEEWSKAKYLHFVGPA